MSLHFEETPSSIRIYFTRHKILDESEMPVAGTDLPRLCRRAAAMGKKLVLDFRGVQFMSSAVIGKLILWNKIAHLENLVVHIANAAPHVVEVFKICKLHKVFRFLNGTDDPDPDDGPDLSGSPVPRPRQPDTLGGWS